MITLTGSPEFDVAKGRTNVAYECTPKTLPKTFSTKHSGHNFIAKRYRPISREMRQVIVLVD